MATDVIAGTAGRSLMTAVPAMTSVAIVHAPLTVRPMTMAKSTADAQKMK